MINKPPELADKRPEEWIQHFKAYFEELRFEFMKVKSVWFAAQSTEQHGDYPTHLLTAAESGFISVNVPRETEAIKEAVIRIIPTTTGTLDWTANLSRGGKNQDESVGTATATADGLAVTDDRITEIDVTTLFAAVNAGDSVGVEFIADAFATTTNVHLLGLILKYR